MTRNTKIYKTSFKEKNKTIEVRFRTLSALEITFFDNIKNYDLRNELAGKTAIINIDSSKVPWPILMKIGEDVYYQSTKDVSDVQLLEICIKDFREKIKSDYVLVAIKDIIEAFPGQSITELLKLTPLDLIELVCLAEAVLKRPLFTVGDPKRRGGLIDPRKLPDDGKSLQEKMNDLNKYLDN